MTTFVCIHVVQFFKFWKCYLLQYLLPSSEVILNAWKDYVINVINLLFFYCFLLLLSFSCLFWKNESLISKNHVIVTIYKKESIISIYKCLVKESNTMKMPHHMPHKHSSLPLQVAKKFLFEIPFLFFFQFMGNHWWE